MSIRSYVIIMTPSKFTFETIIQDNIFIESNI